MPAGVQPTESKNILCSTSMVLLSGALRLRCSTRQLKFWPEYKEDGKRTELRATTPPTARSSGCDWLLMLLPLFPTCQVTTAAGATLCTKHATSVYSSPFSHPVRESTVMFGGAVRERRFKAQGEMKIRQLDKISCCLIHGTHRKQGGSLFCARPPQTQDD